MFSDHEQYSLEMWWYNVERHLPQAKAHYRYWDNQQDTLVTDFYFAKPYLEINFPELKPTPQQVIDDKWELGLDIGIRTIRASRQMLGKKILPRFIPYVGWGLLTYDVYQLLS